MEKKQTNKNAITWTSQFILFIPKSKGKTSIY